MTVGVMRAVVIGSSGGIGGALTEDLARHAHVHALSRNPGPDSRTSVTTGQIDLEDEDSIAAAARQVAVAGAPDLVIVASGVLHDPQRGVRPEKNLKSQTLDAFQRVFAVNTFGPALVARHFIPIMPRRGRAVFAVLSARVGSISDNHLGGWHAYRASKAALNMLLRNYAIEQARKSPDFICVGLHPGTVDSALSAPFQGSVPDGKLFHPAYSARCLIKVISGLGPADSGQVFDWAGKVIPP